MSKRFELNKVDWLKIGKNSLIFLAPAVIVFLGAIRTGADMKDALYLVYLWVIDVIIDILRKFIAGK